MRLSFVLALFAAPFLATGRGYGQATPVPAAKTRQALSNSAYVLGPGDQITVLAANIDEVSKAYRVDASGNVNPPIVGRVRASGLSPEQLEKIFETRLMAYYTAPDISISVTEYRSQPVSILGAVARPDVYQVQGSRSLFELISLAGGLRTDAGNRVEVSRLVAHGTLPLPGATYDQSGRYMAGEIPVKAILDGKHPIYNIQVEPDDVITVPKAEMVYVIGTIIRAGGYILSDSGTMTALQALSLAGGFARAAAGQHAKILRVTVGSTTRKEIPINLKRITAGKDGDVALQAEDILFVPSSAAQNAALRTFEAAIQVGTGLAIYRP